MSSKNVASKATAKAAAPEKKTAKTAAKGSTEQSKVKTVKKTEKKAEPEKKSASKETEVKKAPVKAPTAKTSVSPKAEESKPKVAPAKTSKAAPAEASPEKKDVKKVPAKEVSVKEESTAKAAGESSAPKKFEDKPAAAPKKADASGKKSSTIIKGEAPSYSILLPEGKKLCKYVMFFEIDEQEERANKKKVSSEMKNLEKKPTSAVRHKISLAEETQEELTERILKELEEQNLAFTREAATQICTRCNKNLVSPEFWVDKHLGYCEECAAILKLGQSKEARKVEYQLGAMGGDSLSEVDDEDFGDGPDAADLRETEEELAEFED